MTYDRQMIGAMRRDAKRRLVLVARIVAFCAFLCAVAGPAAGFQISLMGSGEQGGAPPSTGPYAIAGIVVDSVTGAPIRRALVQLVGATRMVLTGDDGKFRIEGLPRTTMAIVAIKPGYQQAAFGTRSFAPAMAAIGPNSTLITLKLDPESSITVNATGEDGEPVESLPVTVRLLEIQDGRRTWSAQKTGNTDDNGRFRAAELRPGRYYVSAGPSFRPIGQIGIGAAASDLGYTREFYPNAADMDSAVPLDLAPGKSLHVEFSLRAAPLYRVSGTVVGGAIGEQRIVRLFDNSSESLPIGIRVNPLTGEFHTGEVPAGVYTLKAYSLANGRTSSVGSVNVRVDGNLTNVTVAVAPTITIPVTFRSEGGAATEGEDNTGGMVILHTRREGILMQGGFSHVEGEGSEPRTVVTNIEPGSYSITIHANGPQYVASARYGQTDLLTDELVVTEGGGADAIEVTLRSDGASLGGQVRDGENPAAGAEILLIPEGKPQLLEMGAYEGGSFSFGNLAPGDYEVIAFDSTEDLEYRNPEALREYMSKAQEITLGPKQEGRVDLELVHRGK